MSNNYFKKKEKHGKKPEDELEQYQHMKNENKSRPRHWNMDGEEESVRKKSELQTPITIYNNKNAQENEYQEDTSQPYQHNMIVSLRESLEKNEVQMGTVADLSKDVPRQKHMYKGENETYFDTLNTNCANSEDFNKIMLVNEINMHHPRKFNTNGTPGKYTCKDSLGFFWCKDDLMYTEFDKFGVGLGDYFRTLKWLIIFWGLLIIISVVHCWFEAQNKELFNYSNIKSFFHRLSLGNLSRSLSMCQKLDLKTFTATDPVTHTFNCPVGYTIQKEYIADFGVTDMDSLNYCNEFSTNNLMNMNPGCPIRNQILKLTTCDSNLNQCKFSMPLSDFKSNCKYIFEDSLVFSYQCHYINTVYFDLVFYIIDVINVVILLCATLFLYFIHPRSQTVQYENNYQITQYSVHIKNISLNKEIPLLYKDLDMLITTLTNASTYLDETSESEEDEAEKEKKKKNVQKEKEEVEEEQEEQEEEEEEEEEEKEEEEKEREQVQKEAEENGDYFNTIPIVPTSCLYQLSYPNFEYVALDMIKKRKEILSKYEVASYDKVNPSRFASVAANVKYNLQDQNDAVRQIKAINQSLNFIRKAPIQTEISDIFVTCKSKLHAKKIYDCYNSKNCCIRFWLVFCCEKDRIDQFYFKNKWLNVDYLPASPDGIKWENMRYPSIKRYGWHSLSAFLMFVFLIITISIFYYGSMMQRLFEEEYDNYLDCSKIDISNTNNVFYEHYSKRIPNRNKVMSSCYCRNYLNINGSNKTSSLSYIYDIVTDSIISTSAGGKEVISYPCVDWVNKLEQMNITYIVIYVLIPVLNIIAYICFPYISKMERHKTIMSERKSTMIKTFVYCLFSNGLSIILVNIYIQIIYSTVPLFPLFTGFIRNFNSVWYYHVGTTITLLMIINILTPHLIELIKTCMVTIIRKQCLGDIFKENNKHRFLFWYIGHEYEFELLGMTCIGILFSNILPIINLPIILSYSINFGIGKGLFISYCKNPPKFDQQLTKTALIIMYVFIFIRCFLAIWINGLIYGLPESMSIIDFIIELVKIQKLYFYLIIPGLMLIVPFIYYIFYECIGFTCCELCNPAYGFAENKKIEQDAMKDFTIYESLPLSALYKNYVIRKVEFTNLNKYAPNIDITTLLRFYKQRLDTDRAAINAKLKFLTGKECAIDEFFDKKIKLIMDRYKDVEETKINNDFSYSMAYSPVYESYFLGELVI